MSYPQLEKTYYRLAQLGHASAMLGWDQQVLMPMKSNESRGRALAELSVITTEILQEPGLADCFAAADEAKQGLDDWQQANLREMRRVWQQANAIPKALVEAEVLATNQCEHAWRSLRADNNWHDFEPLLQQVFDLARDKAQAIRAAFASEKGFTNDYEALLDVYDAGTRSSRIDPVFHELKQTLPELVQQIMARQAEFDPIIPPGPVAKQRQTALARELMTLLGFDFDAGRLDEAAHPFSGGVSDDSRITARFDENNVIEGIMAIIHETGHSRYETGLPGAWRNQPVGKAMGMGLHESQSLFLEMQLGRSLPFLQAITPLINKHFGSDPAFSANNLNRLQTQVKPGLIRVNADEVTYPLHVILRYEIERDIILGQLAVQDIPERWQQGMQSYLGVESSGNYKDGPMQDIHWPAGAIGYFPSYTLGAINAAQLHAAMIKAIPKAADLIKKLDFAPIFDWLAANIWQHGRKLSYDQLMIRATGETLNSRYFLDHLRTRYL